MEEFRYIINGVHKHHMEEVLGSNIVDTIWGFRSKLNLLVYARTGWWFHCKMYQSSYKLY